MLNITPAFASLLGTAQMSQPERLNSQLREFFLSCESGGAEFANPEPHTHRNDALYESNFSLFDWKNPAVSELRDFCWENVYQLVRELNGYDLETLQRLHIAHESWFHITRKGGYFGVHNHPMHSWSGVYCVCQEGDEKKEHSGKLTFINPFGMTTMYMDMSMYKMRRPFSMGDVPVRLKPGQLVLFPSWLLHEVTPFEPEGEGLRITVAFNVKFRLLGAMPPKPPPGL